MMIPFISENEQQLLKNHHVDCKVENGIGVIFYRERSFKISLLSANQRDFSSQLEKKNLELIAQKVAVILVNSEILTTLNNSQSLLKACITKNRITNLNNPFSYLEIKENNDYIRIEAYLFQVLDKTKSEEETNGNGLASMPLNKLIRPSPFLFPPPLLLSKASDVFKKNSLDLFHSNPANPPVATPPRFPIDLDTAPFIHTFFNSSLSLDQKMEDLKKIDLKHEFTKDKAIVVADQTEKMAFVLFYLLYSYMMFYKNQKELEIPSEVIVEDVTNQPEEEKKFTDSKSLIEKNTVNQEADPINKNAFHSEQKPIVSLISKNQHRPVRLRKKKVKRKNDSQTALTRFSKSSSSNESNSFSEIVPAYMSKMTMIMAVFAMAYPIFKWKKIY